MAISKRELFLKRRMRTRSKLRKMANGRPRLSVHRSSKNISVRSVDRRPAGCNPLVGIDPREGSGLHGQKQRRSSS